MVGNDEHLLLTRLYRTNRDLFFINSNGNINVGNTRVDYLISSMRNLMSANTNVHGELSSNPSHYNPIPSDGPSSNLITLMPVNTSVHGDLSIRWNNSRFEQSNLNTHEQSMYEPLNLNTNQDFEQGQGLIHRNFSVSTENQYDLDNRNMRRVVDNSLSDIDRSNYNPDDHGESSRSNYYNTYQNTNSNAHGELSTSRNNSTSEQPMPEPTDSSTNQDFEESYFDPSYFDPNSVDYIHDAHLRYHLEEINRRNNQNVTR